jgi:hypothetical protein
VSDVLVNPQEAMAPTLFCLERDIGPVIETLLESLKMVRSQSLFFL